MVHLMSSLRPTRTGTGLLGHYDSGTFPCALLSSGGSPKEVLVRCGPHGCDYRRGPFAGSSNQRQRFSRPVSRLHYNITPSPKNLTSRPLHTFSKTAPADSLRPKLISPAWRMSAIVDTAFSPSDSCGFATQVPAAVCGNPCIRPIAERLPPGAWDSHMHVVDPDRYPLSSEASYRPTTHNLEDAISFEKSIGIFNIVLVQPSIYGFDNSHLLDALAILGPKRARGVVVCDPEITSEQQLREWHIIGVRGVRVNHVSNSSDPTVEEMQQCLQRYADLIRPLKWVLQVYLPMSSMAVLEKIAPALNVKICIDHMGYPSLPAKPIIDPYSLAGFSSLVRLLQQDDVYVKLSAPYRLSKMRSLADLEPVAKELLRLHGTERVVFATDWPHTRFEGLDIKPWIEKVLDWCEAEPQLCESLFVTNAEKLWDVQQ